MTEAESTERAREKAAFSECHDELRKMSCELSGEITNPRMEAFRPDVVAKHIEGLDFISHRMQRASQGFTTWREARDAIFEAGFHPAWFEREKERKRTRILAPAKVEEMPVSITPLLPSDQLPDLGPEFKVLGKGIARAIAIGRGR